MAYYTNRNGSSFFSNVPTVTRTLLVINIIMFVATLFNEDFMIEKFALFYPTSYFFRWWQPLSHMFMHGGFWHIFFNMYTLLMFGSIIERTIGEKKFLILYFVCGFGARSSNLVAYFVSSLLTRPRRTDLLREGV